MALTQEQIRAKSKEALTLSDFIDGLKDPTKTATPQYAINAAKSLSQQRYGSMDAGDKREPGLNFKNTSADSQLTDADFQNAYGVSRTDYLKANDAYRAEVSRKDAEAAAHNDRGVKLGTAAMLAVMGGGALLGGGSAAAAGAETGGLLGGGTSIAALTPEAVAAGGTGAANAAVAGMGGAAGIGSAGGALGVAGGGLLGGGSISALTPAEVYAGGMPTANSAVAGITPTQIGMAGAEGATSIGALTPAQVQAGGTTTANSTLNGITPSSIANSGTPVSSTNYFEQAQKALKAGSAVQGLMGGSSQGGGMAGDSTSTNQIDPRMAKYIYGDDTTKGILDIARGLYEKNPDGMNEQMRQGLNNQWNTLNDPALKQGYQQMANTGMGLLSMPIAGNPFSNGMGGRPQAMQSQQMPQFNPSAYQGLLGGSQQMQSPFSLMNAGKALIPDEQYRSGSNSNIFKMLGG